MALQKEIWVSQIVENIYPKNSFINYSVNHSDYVNGKVVHVPQAGATATITKNQSSFPLTATQRTDADLTYNIDSFSTNAWFVTDIEQAQISYAKMQSVLGNATKELERVIAENVLYGWATTAFSGKTYTSGASTNTALARNATGTRKAIAGTDLAAVKKLMDAHNIPVEGRKILLPADMYNQLIVDADIKAAYSFGSAVQASGVVNTLYGFELIMRSYGVSVTSGGTVNVVDAAGAATDNLAAIAWHPDFATFASASTDVFFNPGQALFQGDVMSALSFAGGRSMRTDGKGIYLLIQG